MIKLLKFRSLNDGIQHAIFFFELFLVNENEKVESKCFPEWKTSITTYLLPKRLKGNYLNILYYMRKQMYEYERVESHC